MAAAVESMAWAGETPWHGLGVKVGEDLTPAEMLVEAGLNWEVYKIPLFGEVDGVTVKADHHFIARDSDNSILGETTENWNLVQNAEAFELFQRWMDKSPVRIKMHTAGSLNNGKMVWGLAKLEDGFSLFGGDDVESYLLFSNPHEFGKVIDIRFTPTRVVCNNTLTMALKANSEKDKVATAKMTHRTPFDINRAEELVFQAHEKLNDYKNMAEFLGSKRIADQETLAEYADAVFPIITKREKSRKDLSKSAKAVLEAYDKQPGTQFAAGSWWQALNAVTFHVDHEMARTPDNRLESAWYGPGRQKKMNAVKLAVEFAESA